MTSSEERDALLSAQRDRALEAEEASRLARLLEGDASAKARAQAFEAVDAALHRLASAPVDGARLERARDEIVSRYRNGVRRRSQARLAFAAAALAAGIAAVALWLPNGDVERGAESAEESSALVAPALDDDGDFEVIAELELLEYLTARDSRMREVEPRG